MGLERINYKNVFCIGRNYADHAKELNNPIPETPLVFLKPSSSIVMGGGAVLMPSGLQELHHEVELVLLVGKNKLPAGLAVGVDITARQLQSEAKKKGEPWLLSKGQKTFAPLSNFVAFPGNQKNFLFELKVNQELRQSGDSSDMLFPIPVILNYLDATFGLQEGDLIFTGTPKGVGPLRVGDSVSCKVTEPALSLQFLIKPSQV